MTKEECIADLKSIKVLEQQPSDDCVSRQAIIDMTGLSNWFESSDDYNSFVYELCKVPPATPTRKKARWIKQYTAFVNDDNQIVTECHCTNCYGISYFRSMGEKLVGAKYCPNCGYRMIKE